MRNWSAKDIISKVTFASVIGGLALGFGERAMAVDPCSPFEAVGIGCDAVKLTVFQRTDGRSHYFRSAARALKSDRQTFACCASGVPISSLFLVRAYDLELVSEEGVSAPDSARACGIPVVRGLDELRGYLTDEESAAGLLSFQGSEEPKTPLLVEIRGRSDAPTEGQLGGGLCNMAGDTSLWTDPTPSVAMDDDAAFAGWARTGEVVLVHLEAEEAPE